MASARQPQVLALSGGVGGAKLSLGLADVVPAGDLHLLINTGDDFNHLGLDICPDIDTHLYTLAGLSNTAQGWGLAGESWHTMAALEQLGGETWFRLGDKDLATHLWRTQQRAAGQGMAAITAALAQRMGISCHVYPMTEDPVHTVVHTEQGELPFQQYFVRDQCQPVVTGFSFSGIDSARPNPRVLELLAQHAISSIVICPSNPFVSVDPILQVPGLWRALCDNPARVVVVSPIVAGMAIKGPAAKMMTELGMAVTAEGVARHYIQRYPGLMDCFVIDESDATLAAAIEQLGVEVAVTPTVMTSREDKQHLARVTLRLGEL